MAIVDQLEKHLADKSYLEGYTPSQADVAAFKESYTNEHDGLPGDKGKKAESYLPAASTSAAAPAAAADDDDDIDLFGSDDEEVDEEAEKLKQQRLAEYAAKKANKPKTIAKSVVTLDVKPWDDETDMAALEQGVRSIEQEGLVWGASKLVPIGYGIRKLQITLVIEDELVSLDELQEKLADQLEDYVQSSDVQAMQKL